MPKKISQVATASPGAIQVAGDVTFNNPQIVHSLLSQLAQDLAGSAETGQAKRDLTPFQVKDKIAFNDLSDETWNLYATYLGYETELFKILESENASDATFKSRLMQSVKTAYLKAKASHPGQPNVIVETVCSEFFRRILQSGEVLHEDAEAAAFTMTLHGLIECTVLERPPEGWPE